MSTGESRTCMGCMSLTDSAVCSACGYDVSLQVSKNFRQPGSVLASRFLLGAPHHQNGEGVTYIGKDNQSGRTVWVQEYYPENIARRDWETGFLIPKADCGAQYKALLSDCMDLCNDIRRLSISDPVIPLLHMISENNTLYAVFQDMGLIPLEQYMEQRGNRLDEAEATALLLPLFHAVANMHNRGVIHRGISPYTVYVNASGALFMGGFALSATRTAGSELPAELFNGYTAPEQYSPSGWQGTWTDLYALAGIYYRTVSGLVPPKSVSVGENRRLTPLAELIDGISPNVSTAIENAMRRQPGSRTQTVAAFIAQMTETGNPSTTVYDVSRVAPAVIAKEQEAGVQPAGEENGRAPMRYVWIGLACVLVLLGGLLAFVMTQRYTKPPEPGSSVAGESAEGSDPDGAESSAPETDTQNAVVPSFHGMSLVDVQANPDYNARFIFSEIREEFSEHYDAGVIIGQSPAAGTNMPNRGVVILHVSKGKQLITMPDFAGMTAEQVMQELSRLSDAEEITPTLSFEAYQIYDENTAPNTVVRTLPVAGSEFNPSEEVIQVFFSIEQQVSESAQRPQASSSSSAAPSRGGEIPDGSPVRNR